MSFDSDVFLKIYELIKNVTTTFGNKNAFIFQVFLFFN